MSVNHKRIAWVAAMIIGPFAIGAFSLLSLNAAAWPFEVRMMVGIFGFFGGAAAASYPYRRNVE